MVTPTTRAGKGSELSWAELDANWTDLAAAINRIFPTDVSFGTSIPFTGNSFMPQQSVSGALAFTVNATGAVRDARCYVRLVANGTNTPSFTGFKEWGGSMGYDARSGIVNELSFWYDGNDFWYSFAQAVGATAIDTVAPTFTTAQVANATRAVIAITMSETLDAASVPATSAFSASGGRTVTGVAISGTTVNVTVNTAYAFGDTITVTYTKPGTGMLRDTSGNQTASFGPSSVTNNIATVPGAPTIGTATAGNTTASVAFTAPGSNGGATITGYTATSSPGGLTGTGSASPITVSGLTNGTAYTFTVTATNSEGTGSASAASNSVTPSAGATAPGAPTGLTLGTATSTTQPLTWTAPASDGGSAITDYVVQYAVAGSGSWSTFSDGTSTTASATVTGLTASTSYDYRVAAVNAIGTGSYSSTATGSTAAAPSFNYLRIDNATKTGTFTETGDSTNGYTYAGSQSFSSGKFMAASTPKVPDGAWVAIRGEGLSEGGIVGLDTASAPAYFTVFNVGVWISSGNWTRLTNGGSVTSLGVASAAGQIVRLRRSGNDVIAELSTNEGASWSTMYTWTSITNSSEVLYAHFSAANTTPVSNIIRPHHSGMTA